MGPDGEYAAAASYTAVLDAFGQVEPYATIQAAEQRHIDALTRQLQRTSGLQCCDRAMVRRLGRQSAGIAEIDVLQLGA